MKTCSNCQKIVEPILNLQGPHLGEYCPHCAQWLGWVPQNKPYNPNWRLTWGEHKGKTISSLPTIYLEYMWKSEKVTGTMKKWFRHAYCDRHVAFLDRLRLLIDVYIDKLNRQDKMGVYPTVAEVCAMFIDYYHSPKVNKFKFDKYLNTALEMVFTGEIVFNWSICFLNGCMYFTNQAEENRRRYQQEREERETYPVQIEVVEMTVKPEYESEDE